MSRNDPGQFALLRPHSEFLKTGTLDVEGGSLVAASWRRSVAAGIDAERLSAPVTLEHSELRFRLSPRHSEIMVLLMEQPSGITGDQLEIQLYPSDVHRSTMRAEMTRLRTCSVPMCWNRARTGWSGGPGVTGRSWQTAGRRSRRRGVDGLPRATAPLFRCAGGVAVRDGLHRDVTAAVLAGGVPDLMASWTKTRWGAEDVPMWRRQAELLPRSSPLRLVAAAEALRLDELLGSSSVLG